MKYTMQDLFFYMDQGKPVRVKSVTGETYSGPCWAYGDVQNEEEYGVNEASLEIGPGIVLYLSEIAEIEMLD